MVVKPLPITSSHLRRAASRAGRVNVQSNGSGKAKSTKRPTKRAAPK